ncbi:MAG: iron-sulfur cluster-binding domain-containing protein, partial [Bacteroidota bacterium]
ILLLPVDGENLRKAYSLSSSPLIDPHLSITVKRTTESASLHYLLEELTEGDQVGYIPPHGEFTAHLHAAQIKHYLFLVAGIGVSAVISMIRSILEAEPNSLVSIWYGSRTEEDIIFKEELLSLRIKYEPRLVVYFTLTRPSDSWKGPVGRLNKEKVYELISDLFMSDDNRKAYYICGPSEMMAEALEALDKHAVHHSDIFQLNYELTTDMLWEASQLLITNKPEIENQESLMKFEDQTVKITMDGEDFEVKVSAGKTILEAAMDAQLDPPYSCQAGICTTCKAMLHNGEIHMEENEGLTDEELEEGYILTCQAQPLSADVELEFEE